MTTSATLTQSPYHSYGYAYITSNDYQQAINHFQSLIDKNPNDYLSYQGISVALSKQGKYEDAIANLSSAIKIKPDQPSFYFFQSIYYLKINQKSEALLSVQKGLAIDPQNECGLGLLKNISQAYTTDSKEFHLNPLYWGMESDGGKIGRMNLNEMMVYWSPGKPGCIEPSCICLDLPIEDSVTKLKDLPAYPDYFDIDLSQRAYYLNWLNGGRMEPLSDSGYLFLYLFGLERRVLLDEKDDILVLHECISLKRKYASTGSFLSYISNFIAYIVSKNLSEFSKKEFKELFAHTDSIGPYELRVILSWYGTNNVPIPGFVAYYILYHYFNHSMKLGVKELRVKRDLFLTLFDRVYPKGFPIQSSPVSYKITYNPSNSYLKTVVNQHNGYYVSLSDNPLRKKGQFSIFKKLWDEILKIDSITDIDEIVKKYKEPGKKQLKNDKLSIEMWESIISQVFIDENNGNDIVPLQIFDPLIPVLDQNSNESTKLSILQSFVNSQGYELIPNTNGKYDEKRVNIGIITKPSSVSHSRNYPTALFFLELGMHIIHADNIVKSEEMDYLSQYLLNQFLLNSFDNECIELYTKLLVNEPPNPEKIREALKLVVNEDQKSKIASFIIEIIFSDYYIDELEIDALIEILGWMGFPPSTADTLIQNRLVEMSMEKATESMSTGSNTCQESPLVPFLIDEQKRKMSLQNAESVVEIMSDILS